MTIAIDTHIVAFHVAQPAALEEAAHRFADLDPAEAEAVIDACAAGAIAGWRLEDATYWQRVKFRARLIRTLRRTEAGVPPAEAKSLPSAGHDGAGES